MDIRFVCACGQPIKTDAGLVGQTVACPNCQQSVTVPPTSAPAEGPADGAAEAPPTEIPAAPAPVAPATPLPPMTETRPVTRPREGSNYYYANAAGQPVGPYSASQLEQLSLRGTINDSTRVLIEGRTEWQSYAGLLAAPSGPPARPSGSGAGPLPKPLTPPKAPISEGRRQGALVTGIVGCVVGLVGFIWSIVGSLLCCGWLGWPLVILSLVLAIVSLALRRHVVGWLALVPVVLWILWMSLGALFFAGALSEVTRGLKMK